MVNSSTSIAAWAIAEIAAMSTSLKPRSRLCNGFGSLPSAMWNASPVEAEKQQIVRNGAVTMHRQIVVTEPTEGHGGAAFKLRQQPR